MDTGLGIGRIHHSAALAAHALWLLGKLLIELWVELPVLVRLPILLIRVLLVGELLILVRLTVLLVGIHWLTVGVSVGIRRQAQVGTGNGDYQSDDAEEKTAAEPSAEVLIAFAFHNVANNEAPYSCCNSTADNDADYNGSSVS